MASNGSGAKALLMKEYRNLQKEKWVNVEIDEAQMLKWSIALMVVNSESVFDGGYFKCELNFPMDYPMNPPTFKFLRPIFHPNIYLDGKVCISILHAPGEDLMSGETATERWTPLQGAESVLRSILLLLDSPETSSPANVDAGVMFRKDHAQYVRKAKSCVEASKKDIPAGFVMPTTLEEAPPAKPVEDDSFWQESDADEDFGGSDSSNEDEEMTGYDDDEDGDMEFMTDAEEGSDGEGSEGSEEEEEEEL